MKSSALNRIIIWSVTSVLLIFVLFIGIIIGSGINQEYTDNIFYDTTREYDDNDNFIYGTGTSFDADEISCLDICWAAGKVVIEENDEDEIKIREYSESTNDELSDMLYRFDENDMRLDIISSYSDIDLEAIIENGIDSFISYDGTSEEKTLVISVPRNEYFDYLTIATASADMEIIINTAYYNTINLNTFSGSITADNLDSSTIYVNTANGDSELSNVTTNDVEINTVSGDVSISGQVDYLEANSVSADINFEAVSNYNVESINVSSVSGNVNLIFPEDYSGFTIETTSLSGNFNSKFSGKQYSDQYIYGNGYTEINFNAVSGRLNISPAESKTEETTQAETAQAEAKAEVKTVSESAISKEYTSKITEKGVYSVQDNNSLTIVFNKYNVISSDVKVDDSKKTITVTFETNDSAKKSELKNDCYVITNADDYIIDLIHNNKEEAFKNIIIDESVTSNTIPSTTVKAD